MGQGFYKLSGTDLLYAANYVLSKDYQLYAPCCSKRLTDGQWQDCPENETAVEYTENQQELVDGWYWFNTRESAKTFFGVTEDSPVPEPLVPPRPTRPAI